MSVIVVGGGVIGVTTAYFLARSGRQVTVVDRAPTLAAGASFANGGMLTPSLVDPWNAPGILWQLLRWLGKEDAPMLLRAHVLPQLIDWGVRFIASSSEANFRASMQKNLRLSVYSIEVMRALREQLNLRYDQDLRGSMKVFRSAEALADSGRRSGILSEFGLELESLDREGVLRKEPALAAVADSLVGGVFCASDESGDARIFTEVLGRAAADIGVNFRLGEPPARLEIEGGRVNGVVIAQERLRADAVVVAAGCWTPALLRTAGLRAPVQPVKGYSITVDAANWPERPRTPVIDDALHAAVTPLGDRLRVAGTAEITGFDTRLSPSRIANLHDLLLGIYPGFAPYLNAATVEPWAGLRPVSPDGVPIIGSTRHRGLFVNTGHGHLGWTMAAGSGKLLADLVSGRRPDLDLQQFAIDRFR